MDTMPVWNYNLTNENCGFIEPPKEAKFNYPKGVFVSNGCFGDIKDPIGYAKLIINEFYKAKAKILKLQLDPEYWDKSEYIKLQFEYSRTLRTCIEKWTI